LLQKLQDATDQDKKAMHEPDLGRFHWYATRIRELQVLEGYQVHQSSLISAHKELIAVSSQGFRKIAVAANRPILPHLKRLAWCPQKVFWQHLDLFLHMGLEALRLPARPPEGLPFEKMDYLIDRCPQLQVLEAPNTTPILPQSIQFFDRCSLRHVLIKADASVIASLSRLNHLETLTIWLGVAGANLQNVEFTSLRKLKIIRTTGLNVVEDILTRIRSRASLQSLEVISKEGGWPMFCANMQEWITRQGLTELRLAQDEHIETGQQIDALPNICFGSLTSFVFRTPDPVYFDDGRLLEFAKRHLGLVKLDLRSYGAHKPRITIRDLEYISKTCRSLKTLGIVFKGSSQSAEPSHLLEQNHPLQTLLVGNTVFQRLSNNQLEHLGSIFPNVQEIDGETKTLGRDNGALKNRQDMLEKYRKALHSFVVHCRQENAEPFGWSEWELPGRQTECPTSK
jgi:hypothetical protein